MVVEVVGIVGDEGHSVSLHVVSHGLELDQIAQFLAL